MSGDEVVVEDEALVRAEIEREDLFVPDRFEALRKAGEEAVQIVVDPVDEALAEFDRRFAEMRAARRGGLSILRGDTGAGKSTFLDTVPLFRPEVITERVPAHIGADEMLAGLGGSGQPRVIVLEGREALKGQSDSSIEAVLHVINEFVRSEAGSESLVVWPTNTDELAKTLLEIGSRLGAEALFGSGQQVQLFTGPPAGKFVSIAEKTVQALNRGAGLATMGIADERAAELAGSVETIGGYMAVIREELLSNGEAVRALLTAERYRVWTVVIAGNEPENDVAAVTRGRYGFVDIDRLLSATDANVVTELKRVPEKLGLLGAVLDARIVHVNRVTALALARECGDEQLHELMRSKGMVIKPAVGKSAVERLIESELGRLLASDGLGTRRRGAKPGGSTAEAFNGLAEVARSNDGAINRAIGRGLEQSGLIDSFDDEREVGGDLNLASDLYLVRGSEAIRLEIMWRSSTSRAGIANYVLRKLHSYGRTIGYLD